MDAFNASSSEENRRSKTIRTLSGQQKGSRHLSLRLRQRQVRKQWVNFIFFALSLKVKIIKGIDGLEDVYMSLSTIYPWDRKLKQDKCNGKLRSNEPLKSTQLLKLMMLKGIHKLQQLCKLSILIFLQSSEGNEGSVWIKYNLDKRGGLHGRPG